MKKFIPLIMALAMFWACGEDKPITPVEPETSLSEQIIGEWHYTSAEADIYLGLSSDSSFELYQKIGDGRYRLYRGTWNLEEDILTGKYNDGEDWAAAYQISIEGETLTMTSKNDAAEVSVYKKAEIPSTVKETSETIVKSL